MKVIQVAHFGEPKVMEWKDVPARQPGPGEVVVAIKAAGVNPVDTYVRSGSYPLGVRLPYVPGMDGAGVIKKVGAGVRGFTASQRVYISGPLAATYAEEAVCQAKEVIPLPENLTFSQGAALGIPYATAYRALFTKAQAVANETVLIHGASGSVGVAALQLAKNAGLTVVGTAGSKQGLTLVKQLGADYAFDHTQAGYQQNITEATSKKGVDIVLEMLANVNLNHDLEMLALDGRIVIIGCRGDIEINPRRIMQKDAVIKGMLIMNVRSEQLQKIYSSLNQFLVDGKFAPVVGKEFALKDAAQAHEDIISSSACGKIVLIP